MFEKIKNVEPLDNLILRVTFQNGKVKIYDVKPLTEEIEDFKALKNNTVFKNVKTDTGGYGISWNDFLDLECTELWENGTLEAEYKAVG